MEKKREKSLTDILRFYGMPEENIDLAINQIAQGYGACRYLDGVKDGAEAVGSMSEKDGSRKKEVISFGDFSNIIADKVIHFGIDESNKRCFKIFLEGPFTVTNQYDTEEVCKKSFENFAKLMNEL